MANLGLPEFLVGHAATVVAFVFLFASVFMILALAMVQMKTEKLEDAFRQARKSSKKTRDVEQELDVEMGPQKPKKKRSRKLLGKFGRFFVGEPIAETGRDESPYELDDDVWTAPENAAAHVAAQQMEAYDLPDDFWSAPFITV